MIRRTILLTALFGLLATGFVYAGRPADSLKVGDKAPGFTLPDHNGKQVSLDDFKGKKSVILAFYIKASTGG
jgi:cytochrome oxidase Cu insertion factor (SCO1/SenC/PrrC family)